MKFAITFTYPWLLLLLIPAVALTLWPYFRSNKRFRRNRNRVISVALHMVIMVLCVLVLAGINFSLTKINQKNEVILLVDTSYSGRETLEQKNEFISSVIDEDDSEYKLGIVTFGYDQVYAVELTDNMGGVYNQYLNADSPDTSATDIASAITYAVEKFTSPTTAKLIILSDGFETDNDALAAAKVAAAAGIRIDTVRFDAEFPSPEVQISGMTLPDYNVKVGKEVSVYATVEATHAGQATVTLTDNGASDDGVKVNLVKGVNTVELKHTFQSKELHNLSAQVSFATETIDTDETNNKYNAYLYIDTFDKILLIQGRSGEADELKKILSETYDVTVTLPTEEAMPKTLDEIRVYDQVVLVNIANSDLEGLTYNFVDDVLYPYVYELGGGLFTVGGGEENDIEEAHAYNRNDLRDENGGQTTLQKMLPVEAIEYTLPIGIVVIVDCSGSMSSYMEEVTEGLLELISQLHTNDYCAIMSMTTDYSSMIGLTPASQKNKLRSAVMTLGSSGGTLMETSFRHAGEILESQENIALRHIIFISDCQIGDSADTYEAVLDSNYSKNITLSVYHVGGSGVAGFLKKVTDLYGEEAIHEGITASELYSDIRAKQIAITYDEYAPTIKLYNEIVDGVTQADMPTLGGYYGVKLKDNAEEVLHGEYTPIYAQWTYGKGKVGSFMCDLSGGQWSKNFVSSDTGKKIITNIIDYLFPTSSVQLAEIEATLEEDNYGNTLSVFTTLNEGESLVVEVISPSSESTSYDPADESSQTKFTFTIKESGLHTIIIKKVNSIGVVLSTATVYKAFSYSEEYNAFPETDDIVNLSLLQNIASAGKGEVIEEVAQVFEGLDKEQKSDLNPRLVLIIIALVLFILDVAVRKFKFKWIHEIIRERRQKKQNGIG